MAVASSIPLIEIGNALSPHAHIHSEDVVSAAILKHGIWIDPITFQQRPHLVPFAVRDATSRSIASPDGRETWGSPTVDGYFRDDNSLIKEWIKSITVRGPNPAFDGKRAKRGFVACHVWRGEVEGRPLHANPLLNSFVPNLVWLPRDLARMSDQVGSYTQRLLQVIARKLYLDVEFGGRLGEYVRKSWRLLPEPGMRPKFFQAPLNLFAHDAQAFARKEKSLRDVYEGILRIRNGVQVGKVFSTRYGPGLRELAPKKLDELATFLRPFVAGSN